MTNYLIIELAHLILVFLLSVYTVFACSCNTRGRQQTHLERRQALRERQRQAVMSGRSVRSVIETEVESETTHCPTWVCVGRLAPRLKNQKEVYERIDQVDGESQKMNKEKPPFHVVVESPKKSLKSVKTKNGTNVEYTDIVSNASTKRKDPPPSQGMPPDPNAPPIYYQKPRKSQNNTQSVMATVEEMPSAQPRTQMLPVTPPISAPKDQSPYKYPKELPAKTMMLPPTITAQAPPSLPAKTQMLPVAPSPKPMYPQYPPPQNPQYPSNSPMRQAVVIPPYRQPSNPYQAPQQNLQNQVPNLPYQPSPHVPQNQPNLQYPGNQYQGSQPQNQPIRQPFINASVGAHMPVSQLPAITGPAPLAPPPPQLPYKPSAELVMAPRKTNDKWMNGTVDEAEISEKNRRRENINNWIKKVLTTGIDGLKKEYKEAPNGGTPDMAKTFLNNPTRNRYINIPCCEATRVKLVDDPNYYIHANVVSSSVTRRFICAQAPLNGTIEEFWKMVIFSGLEFIIMLCEFVEEKKSKSAIYFPVKLNSPMKIGKLCTITKVASEAIDKTLTMSTLRITKKDNVMTVRHIHWHNWPDHGVPSNFLSPLRLLKVCKGCQKPIVVHCSAGVGRTGTLVLIFIILESLRLLDFSGVPRLLARLREERYKSIQTEMQYLYVHRCILEYLVHKKYQHSKEDFEKFVKDYKTTEKVLAESKAEK